MATSNLSTEGAQAPLPRYRTRTVSLKGVSLGGKAPVRVQSMLCAPPDNLSENMAQLERLVDAGCEIVRMAVPNKKSLATFEAVCEASPIPVVADIHFSSQLAIESAYCGAAKLRINPGNIGGLQKTAEVLKVAKQCKVPIRIGVNAGSLDDALAARTDLTQAQKLAASAVEYVKFCEDWGFNDLVVSAKAHDVVTTLEAYRQLAHDIPHIPLHLGVTEAGTLKQGLVKSACGLGILLEEGIGNTLRISLTDDPAEEIKACWMLLSALNLRRRGVEIISCPTCGRCQVNLIRLAKEVEERLSGLSTPLKVAVMGCVVNGPGEAAEADVGIACTKGGGVVFAKGETLRKVNEQSIVDTLLEEIEKQSL